MRYEWDERKRASNLEKHRLDFINADRVHEAALKVTLDATRTRDKEPRFADLAEVNEVVLKLVYTMRHGVVRCISLRQASKQERRLFYEIGHYTKD